MSRLRHLISRLSRRRELERERELDEELRSFVSLLEDEAVARGESLESARRNARLTLGGTEQVKERVREQRMGAVVESSIRDARIACRAMTKSPLVSVVAIATLALAIGANTAMFSAVDAVLLEPLPFREPDRLVRLWSSFPERGNPFGVSSLLDVRDWTEQAESFESLAAYPNLSLGGLVYTGGDTPAELETSYVGESFFATLGVEAFLGRTFTDDEYIEGKDSVVLIAHRTWLTRFGGRRSIVGERLSLSGSPYTVVGVMPPSFDFPMRESELWAPLSLIPPSSVPRERYVRWLDVVGRLKPEVSVEEATTEMSAIAARLAEAYPESNEELTRVSVRPLQDAIVSDSRTALLVLLGSVGVVLLIGCANIASLLLAQSEKRSREFALRSALGAGRSRLVRQALVESTVLGIAGATAGLAIAYASLPFLRSLSPQAVPLMARAEVNGRVLGVTVALGLLASVLVGMLPAIRAARRGHQEALSEGARGSLGERRSPARGLLVVVQVALVAVLATGAVLLARSYARLVAVSPGIETSNLLTLSVPIQLYKYPESPDMIAFLDRVAQSVSAVPGVSSAAFVRPLPLRFDTFSGESFAFDIVGRPEVEAADRPRAALRFVGPGYFRTMGIPLLAGRDFEARDDRDSEFVVIANRSAAETHWPTEDAVGARIAVGRSSATVIGVVDNVQQTGLDEQPSPVFYTTYHQTTRVGMTLVVRVAAGGGGSLSLVPAVRQAIWNVDADQPIRNIATMEDVLAASLAGPRFSMGLLATFASVALVLAAIGIYGVVAYGVSRRTQEFGLRMALGANGWAVLLSVMREGAAALSLGLAVGIVTAWGCTRFLADLLFEVGTRDPWTFVAVAGGLFAIGLSALMLPARSATRVDPVSALRSQ